MVNILKSIKNKAVQNLIKKILKPWLREGILLIFDQIEVYNNQKIKSYKIVS